MKQQTPIHSIKDIFTKEFERVFNKTEITPSAALDFSIQFFNNYEPAEIDKESEDYDMLLLQYGMYNLKDLKKFYLDITRQFKMQDDSDEFYQLTLALYYEPIEFEKIESYNKWSIDFPSLMDWKSTIVQTEGFLKTTVKQITSYQIKLGIT